MLKGLGRVFMRGGMITLAVMLGGRPVRLGSRFVLVGGFRVMFLRHDSSSFYYRSSDGTKPNPSRTHLVPSEAAFI
jgi:hypothetical protein